MRQFFVPGAMAAATLLATLAIDAGSAAQAQKIRYCAHYDWWTVNCGFYTPAQCFATISGTGGWCTDGRNGPHIYGPVPDTPARPRRRIHRD